MTPELTRAQLDALKADILANPDPQVATWRDPAVGDDGSIAAWYNAAHASVKAWRGGVTGADLFAAMDVAKFDGLTAGKRDAWRVMLDFSPCDFRKAKIRKAVSDAWGADAASILGDCIRAATKAEAVFGGTDRTESTVTAKVLVAEGELTPNDVAKALRG